MVQKYGKGSNTSGKLMVVDFDMSLMVPSAEDTWRYLEQRILGDTKSIQFSQKIGQKHECLWNINYPLNLQAYQ